MLSHVQGSFAGALDIQDGSILASKIIGKFLGVGLVLLAYAGHTTLDSGDFID
jgi:hypothetical protein